MEARTDKYGIYNISVRTNRIGTNNLTVGYGGNDYYNAYEYATKFAVLKQYVNITVDSVSDVSYGDNVTITGKFMDKNCRAISNSNVNVYINGKQYKARTDQNGTYLFTKQITGEGIYNVTEGYGGNNYYYAYETDTTFNVIKTQ